MTPDQKKAIEIFRRNPALKVVIEAPHMDFTPKGRRSVRTVQTRTRFGTGGQLRLYVGGRIFRKLAVTSANVQMAREWVGA